MELGPMDMLRLGQHYDAREPRPSVDKLMELIRATPVDTDDLRYLSEERDCPTVLRENESLRNQVSNLTRLLHDESARWMDTRNQLIAARDERDLHQQAAVRLCADRDKWKKEAEDWNRYAPWIVALVAFVWVMATLGGKAH